MPPRDEDTAEKTLIDAGSLQTGHPPDTLIEGETGRVPLAAITDVGVALPVDDGFTERYEVLTLLGEGGMGEVRLCRDRRIGREVAMKVIRADRTAAREGRFVREARVQGQLEHPAIVPVHDLGRDPAGASYFTMKWVRGLTLEQILGEIRAGDEEMGHRYSRRKLLHAFCQVCLAVDFAHSRGILHRDLKPANVMLGDFGEVYVLDWGLAKPVGQDGPAPALDPLPEEERTAHGVMMGTPGYMAPEQIRGEGVLDERIDVYGLGSLLFEILTYQFLHGRRSGQQVIQSTLLGAEARPSVRAPDSDVPPELEAICVKATARERQERYRTARELHDAVERYLDGDRDLALRRDLAERHAVAAEEAAARALSGERPADERARAMREVGRAVALDPDNPRAMRTLSRLLTEPPRDLPDEVNRTIRSTARQSQRVAARASMLTYLSWFAFSPPAVWMGLRGVAIVAVSVLAWLAAAGVSALAARRPNPEGKNSLAILLASTVAVATAATTFSPFFFLPTIAAVNTMTFIVSPDRSRRAATIAIGCLGFLVPLALEWAGVLPPSYAFRDGTIVLFPRMLYFPAVPTMTFLVVANLALIVVPCLYLGRIADMLAAAERRLHLHAWQLRQMVPGEGTRPG